MDRNAVPACRRMRAILVVLRIERIRGTVQRTTEVRGLKTRIETLGTATVLHATPVVLVSTRSPEGVDNVSPYGMNMPISGDPPLFAIGVHPDRDTFRYIRENGEFAVNILTPDLREACLITARGLPPEESEFDAAGLTRVPAGETDLALVGECPANFECRLHWMKRAGDHHVVVGRVVAAWVDEDHYSEDAVEMRMGFDNLYHIGSHYFRRGNPVDTSGG